MSLINLFHQLCVKRYFNHDTNYLNNNYPVLRKINKNTIITSVDREKKIRLSDLSKNKQQFINLIKQTNFVKDINIIHLKY